MKSTLLKAVECCQKNAEENTTKHCHECPLFSHGDKCLEEKDRLFAEAVNKYEKLTIECEHLKLVVEAQIDVCDTIIRKFTQVISQIGKD